MYVTACEYYTECILFSITSLPPKRLGDSGQVINRKRDDIFANMGKQWSLHGG